MQDRSADDPRRAPACPGRRPRGALVPGRGRPNGTKPLGRPDVRRHNSGVNAARPGRRDGSQLAAGAYRLPMQPRRRPRGPDQSSLSIPMASRWSCRPRRRSSHIREEIQQQLKSSTSRDLHGPGRAFRNDNLAFCSKPAQANHQSDGPVAVDIGPGNHSRGAGLPDRGFTRARGRCSDRACPHYPGHQRDCAAKRGEYPRGTRPGRCSAQNQ